MAAAGGVCCTSDTPPEACSAAGFSLSLIGHRASVGGSVGLADWPACLARLTNHPAESGSTL